MMVDIYHDEKNPDIENVLDYYKKNFKNTNGSIKSIFRFICTHPHQDHICGLAKLLEDNDITIHNFWDLEHEWEPDDFSGHRTHKDDWEAYQNIRKSEKSPKALRNKRDDKPAQYWNDDEDRITILCPSEELIKQAHFKDDGTKRDSVEIDEMSYALLIKVNSRKIILAGDGRASPVWDDILANCGDDIKNCAILNAGHHGHDSSFHEYSVKKMKPELIIFSNSESCDENDGAEESYRKAVPNATILKTCDYGTIIVDCPFNADENITAKTLKGKKIYG